MTVGKRLKELRKKLSISQVLKVYTKEIQKSGGLTSVLYTTNIQITKEMVLWDVLHGY